MTLPYLFHYIDRVKCIASAVRLNERQRKVVIIIRPMPFIHGQGGKEEDANPCYRL